MNERETKKDERLPYSPPEIVFESHTEALAAACNGGGDTNCPSKEGPPATMCDGAPPGNCSAFKS